MPKADSAPIMNILRSGVVAAFLLACFAPMVAVSMSPKLSFQLVEKLTNPNTRAAALETLRKSTPLWNEGVSIYNTALYRLRTSANQSIGVVGRNGWIFLGDSQDKSFAQTIRRMVLNTQETDYWAMTLDAQNRWLAARGIPMVFIVAPSQGNIYPENLPRWAQRGLSAPSSFDRVLAVPRQLPLLDVRPQLREAKPTGRVYSPLNSHWTDYGAWIAWRQVAAELQRKLPGFQPFGAGELKGVEHLADYASEYRSMLGIDAPNPWDRYILDKPFPNFEIIDESGAATVVDGSTRTGLLDLPRITRNPAATSGLKALVLRDSMGDALSPFLQASFSQTVQLNHHRTQYSSDQINFIPAVEKYRPDVVIYIMTERYFDVPLGNTYYWASIDRYENLRVLDEASWTPDTAAASGLRVSDGGKPIRGGDVQWTKDIGPGASDRVLRLQGEATAYGYVRVDYRVGGKTFQVYEELYKGANDLYYMLPAKVDDDRIDFTVGGEGTLSLKRANLKSARP